jgi:D-3-phosphoglycerate dehydrogenase
MSDIFDGGNFVGVVNAPDLGSIAKLEHIVPYVMLAEKIGSIQGQLIRTSSSKIGSITINLRGKDIADSKLTDVVKSAVINSYVNAIPTADELGLKVLVNMSEKAEAGSGYMNLLGVELEIEGFLNATRVIEGTVFGKGDQLRITQIDGYSVDLTPGENMLFFNNQDQPGVLRRIVEKLASAQVNIAHFSLGRKQRGSKAMGVVVTDTPIPAEVLSSLAKYADVTNLVQV